MQFLRYATTEETTIPHHGTQSINISIYTLMKYKKEEDEKGQESDRNNGEENRTEREREAHIRPTPTSLPNQISVIRS
jgi:hypothetical protein